MKGTLNVGGVAGQTIFGATLTACYATGNVIIEIDRTQNISGGGLVGFNDGISLLSCYATGNVIIEIDPVKNISGGGLVGFNGGNGVLACYATGNVTSTGSSTGKVHIFGLLGDNYTTVTACYWKNNQERGYKTAPESTKVDGTYVTWQKAVDAMNRALQNAGSEWRYELKGALPTLRKQ